MSLFFHNYSLKSEIQSISTLTPNETLIEWWSAALIRNAFHMKGCLVVRRTMGSELKTLLCCFKQGRGNAESNFVCCLQNKNISIWIASVCVCIRWLLTYMLLRRYVTFVYLKLGCLGFLCPLNASSISPEVERCQEAPGGTGWPECPCFLSLLTPQGYRHDGVG